MTWLCAAPGKNSEAGLYPRLQNAEYGALVKTDSSERMS